ncbi:type IV secretion protein Rhs, partial [candidate division GN15 bacterium]|nr:type IV secretion protein Rhs [candidate division GN15 bacterium]
MIELRSPDTGITTHGYDPAGNLTTRTDARSEQASYRYDALNRITEIRYSDETIAFGYDEPAGGAGATGNLTTVTDASGATRYGYDRHGRVI